MTKLIKKSKILGQPPETLLYEGKAKTGKVKISVFDYDGEACAKKMLSLDETTK